MKKPSLFTMTFLTVSAGLFAGLFVYGLFSIELSDFKAWINLFFKSLATGIVVGIILGLLNMYFKAITFSKK